MFKDGDCVICQGCRTVRLPVCHPLSARADLAAELDQAPEPRESSRSYPCPECSPAADVVEVAQARAEYPQVEFARASDHLRSSIAHSLADHLLRHGLIEFCDFPSVSGDSTMREMRGKVGVVSIKHRRSIEERIAEHQEDVARDVVLTACADIRNWGSAYGIPMIGKDMACRSVHGALRVALAKAAKR
jgi:hypothetical protein